MVLPKVDTGTIADLQGKQCIIGRITLGNEFPGVRMSSLRSCTSVLPFHVKAISNNLMP